MAPELKKRTRYNAFDVDMYALGVMLFVVVQAGYPFDADDDDKALEQACKPVPDIQWSNECKLTDSCRVLLFGLLEPSPTKRISMCKLVEHAWFSNEMAAIKHTLPPLDQLPKKVAARRFSSPADDIRLRADKKKSSSADQRLKSADGTKQVKSAGQKKRIKSADNQSRKSSRSSQATGKSAQATGSVSRKKSADRSTITSKRKPKSAESRTKSSQEAIGKNMTASPKSVKTQKTKIKTSTFSCSVHGKSGDPKDAKE